MKGLAGVPDLIRIGDLIGDDAPRENRLKIRERPNGGLLWGQFVLATPPADILVDGFLCRGDFALLQGEPGSMKTFLMMDLAIAVAHGRPFLGRYAAKPGNVLIIEEEGQAFDLVNRGKILGARPDSDIVIYHCRGFQVDSLAWLKDLETNLLPLDEYALILIDPLAAVHTGKENEASDMRAVVDFYKKVHIASPLTTVMMLMHTTKSAYGAAKGSLQHGRGSGAPTGAADVVLESIKQGSTNPALVKIELHMPKRRAFAQMGSALAIELDLRQPGNETWKISQKAPEDEGLDVDQSANGETQLDLQEKLQAKILLLAPTAKWTSANIAHERVGGRKGEFLKAWRHLLDTGQLKKVDKFFTAEQTSNHGT